MRIVRSFWPIEIMFFYVLFYDIIKVNNFLYFFIVLLHLISYFSLTRSLLVRYAYASIRSIHCIVLSSFKLNEMLIISSVKALWLSLPDLCCVFNIDLLFLYNFLWFYFKTINAIFIFFLDNLFYFQVQLLLNSF